MLTHLKTIFYNNWSFPECQDLHEDSLGHVSGLIQIQVEWLSNVLHVGADTQAFF